MGRPILLRGRSTNATAASIRLYRDTMEEAGFDEPAIEHNLDQIWVWREMHLAETDEQAMNEFLPAQHTAYSKMQTTGPAGTSRVRYGTPGPADGPRGICRYAGTRTPPKMSSEVRIGWRNSWPRCVTRESATLCLPNRGLMSHEKTVASLKLLSERVMPNLRD